MTLAWAPGRDNGLPISAYELEVAEGDAGSWRRCYEGCATTFTATEVELGKAYQFRVRAINAVRLLCCSLPPVIRANERLHVLRCPSVVPAWEHRHMRPHRKQGVKCRVSQHGVLSGVR